MSTETPMMNKTSLPPSGVEVVKDAIQDKSLDMVRNILFGEQARDNEKRQAALERFVRLTINTWSEETQKKFDSVQREINLLRELLVEETKVRREDVTLNRNKIDEVKRQIGGLDNQTRLRHDELYNLFGEEIVKVEKQMGQWREEVLAKLKQAEEQLRHDKTDRKSLAAMLGGLAKQLDEGTVRVE